jgi:hypothetical protein
VKDTREKEGHIPLSVMKKGSRKDYRDKKRKHGFKIRAVIYIKERGRIT